VHGYTMAAMNKSLAPFLLIPIGKPPAVMLGQRLPSAKSDLREWDWLLVLSIPQNSVERADKESPQPV
jgi:hypothetical protein